MPIVFFKINDIKILTRFYHYRYHYSYHQYTFFAYLLLHIFSSHRVPSDLFQKLLLHIFQKRSRLVLQQVCLLETGR